MSLGTYPIPSTEEQISGYVSVYATPEEKARAAKEIDEYYKIRAKMFNRKWGIATI